MGNAPNISLGSPTLTVWGDSVVGRALVLLLRSSGYKAEFMPALLPSSEPVLPEETRLLVLTPTPQLSAEEREALLASLLADASRAATLRVLALVTSSGATPE